MLMAEANEGIHQIIQGGIVQLLLNVRFDGLEDNLHACREIDFPFLPRAGDLILYQPVAAEKFTFLFQRELADIFRQFGRKIFNHFIA